MEKKRLCHFQRILSFPPSINDSEIICGKSKESNVLVTNYVLLVSCPECKKALRDKCCAICNSPYIVNQSPLWFHNVCQEHVKYATFYQNRIIQLRLGYISNDNNPMECAVCKEVLSPLEIDNISLHDFHLTCFKHSKYKSFFDLSKVKI